MNVAEVRPPPPSYLQRRRNAICKRLSDDSSAAQAVSALLEFSALYCQSKEDQVRSLLYETNRTPRRSITGLSPDIDLDQTEQVGIDSIWYNPNQLLHCQRVEHLVTIFKKFDFLNTFDISESCLRCFIDEVTQRYRSRNPYHNFIHACDVVQFTYYLLTHCSIREKLDDLATFSIIVACLCHDLEHPGKNNPFLVATSDTLAQTYNDQSPLENHHCACFFRIISQPKANIMANLSTSQFVQARSYIMAAILATDMARHNSLCQELRSRFLQGSVPFQDNQLSHPRDLRLLLILLLKAADISNVVRPYPVSRQWSVELMNEFWKQGDEELRKGIPVTPRCDRTVSKVHETTVGFSKFCAKPLFEILYECFPSTHGFLDTLTDNIQAWETQSEDKINSPSLPSTKLNARLHTLKITRSAPLPIASRNVSSRFSTLDRPRD